MTTVVAIAVLVALPIVTWRLWALQREVGQIDERFDAFRQEVARVRQEDGRRIDGRLRGIEAPVAQVAEAQKQITHHLLWTENWVKHWVVNGPDECT